MNGYGQDNHAIDQRQREHPKPPPLCGVRQTDLLGAYGGLRLHFIQHMRRQTGD